MRMFALQTVAAEPDIVALAHMQNNVRDLFLMVPRTCWNFCEVHINPYAALSMP